MALGSLASYLDLADQFFDESEKAERWLVECAIPKADWSTAGTMVGAPVFGGVTSTITANASIFAAGMVASYIKFKASGAEYVVAGFTSGTVITVTGDASGEAAGDTFDVVHGYRILPERGDAPPAAPNAFPARLDIQGTCLRVRVLFTARPGWVVIHLTYGFDITSIGVNKAYVTGRTVLATENIDRAWSAVSTDWETIVGPVTDTAGKATGEQWIVTPDKGYETQREIPFQQVRIHALLNATGLNTYAGPILDEATFLNSAAWTLLGRSIATHQMMFRGVPWDLYRQAPASNRLYTARFDFLIAPFVWSRFVRRSKYKKVSQLMKLLGIGSTSTVGQRAGDGLEFISDDAEDFVLRGERDFGLLLGPLLT